MCPNKIRHPARSIAAFVPANNVRKDSGEIRNFAAVAATLLTLGNRKARFPLLSLNRSVADETNPTEGRHRNPTEGRLHNPTEGRLHNPTEGRPENDGAARAEGLARRHEVESQRSSLQLCRVATEEDESQTTSKHCLHGGSGSITKGAAPWQSNRRLSK